MAEVKTVPVVCSIKDDEGVDHEVTLYIPESAFESASEEKKDEAPKEKKKFSFKDIPWKKVGIGAGVVGVAGLTALFGISQVKKNKSSKSSGENYLPATDDTLSLPVGDDSTSETPVSETETTAG